MILIWAIAGVLSSTLSLPAVPTAVHAPPTPVVYMCLGAEGYPTSIERRPSDIVLECEAYGPQYGNPNVAVLEDLAWLSWSRRSARGYGMLVYGSPLVCPPGQPCTGGEKTRIVAQVRLSHPRPFGRTGSRRTFTKVTVTVSAVPGTQFGPQVFVYTPPRVAYS